MVALSHHKLPLWLDHLSWIQLKHMTTDSFLND